MERSSFFNAELVGEEWDRVYLAEDYARYFASFIGNGVFPNPANQLQVVAIDGNMQVRIKQGKGWINGYFYENTDDLIFKLDPADGVLNRIDRIVLRLDFLNRDIRAVVKKGDYATTAIAKALERNEDAYELALADIKVNRGAISITQANITDLRLNKELCGIVHGTVEQVDTTAIFNQFESWYSQTKEAYDKDIATWTKEKKEAFNKWYTENTKLFLDTWNKWYGDNTTKWEDDFQTWFITIKRQLDGDIGAKLAQEINDIKHSIENIEIPVTKVNGKVGDVILKAEDIKTESGNTVESQMADMKYKKAGGTATEITVTAPSLVDGYSKTFIVSENNNGSVTTINGKPLYKPNTTTSPNLIAGKAVTVWYSSTNKCFFIKASAEGNADVANVLAGKTFSNDNDTGIVGTMPNRGSLAQTLTTQGGQYNLPSGYYSGGYVKAQFPNLIASNIKEGINIGGVVGTLMPNNAYIQKIDIDMSKTINVWSDNYYKTEYYSIGATLHQDVKFLLLDGSMFARYEGANKGKLELALGVKEDDSTFTEIIYCAGDNDGDGVLYGFMTMMLGVDNTLNIKRGYNYGGSTKLESYSYQRDFSKLENKKLWMRMEGVSSVRLEGRYGIKGTLYAISW